MIWSNENGEWRVVKLFKGVSWESVDFSYEHKTQCLVCAEAGNDSSMDNLHVYGNDENGLSRGAQCFSCGTTIISVEKAIEDEQNKSSTDGKISALSKKSNINSIKEESKVSFAANKGNRDEQKLKEVRLSAGQLEKIYSETSEDLKCFYRGLDKSVCKELSIRWKYDEVTGKVSEMWCPYHIKEDGKLTITGYKVRRAKPSSKQQKFYSVGYVGKLNCMFGETYEVNESIIYVGGEIDVVSATQMIRQCLAKYPSRKVTVVSSPLGEPHTAESIKTNWDWVDKHTKHVLALDKDVAGKKSQEACKEVLHLECTLEANLSLEDANEYLNPKNGKTADDYTRAVYWNPTPSRDFGVVDSSYLFESALAKLAQEKIPFPNFLKDLARHFTDNALNTGSWVNFIAGVSSGKSTIFDSWLIDWALTCPYRQAILSYEANAKAFGVKVISLATSKAVLRIEGKENRIDFANQHKEEVMKLLVNENGESRFDLVDKLPSSSQEAKDLFTYLVKIRNVKVIVIDPLVDFLTICKDQADQEELVIFMDNLRMSHDVTFMCALHTRKNLSNGANTSKGGEVAEEDALNSRLVLAKGTVNITSWRNKDSDDEVERNTVYLSIKKNRDDAVTGVTERLFYRFKANKLYPYSYAESRNFFYEDDKVKTEDIIIDDNEGFSLDCLGVTNVDQITDDSDPELNF